MGKKTYPCEGSRGATATTAGGGGGGCDSVGGGAGGWLAILMGAISRLTSGSNAANAPFFRAASSRSKIEPRASACKGAKTGRNSLRMTR